MIYIYTNMRESYTGVKQINMYAQMQLLTVSLYNDLPEFSILISKPFFEEVKNILRYDTTAW